MPELWHQLGETATAAEFQERTVLLEQAVLDVKIEPTVDSSWKVTNKRAISPEEWARLTEAAQHLALPNIWFDDRSGLSPLQIRAKARRVQAEVHRLGTPLRLILIDYVQLLDGTAGGRKQQDASEADYARLDREGT